MNIVFFGTSEFAVESLRALLSSRHKVLAVVTQPDREKGRNLRKMPPATKVLAEAHEIRVFQPENASDLATQELLAGLKADIYVVIAFGQILRSNILSLTKYGAINVHGSLLPRYRGAAPTNWAIIDGERASGVTVMRMNERLDEGDIVLAREVAIEDCDTNITLSETLAALGAKALLDALDLIEKGAATYTRQDSSKMNYARKLTKEDGRIDWAMPARTIRNRVRGLLPWPTAYTTVNGKLLKILSAKSRPSSGVSAKPGEIVAVEKGAGFIVSTGEGDLVVDHVQLEGKKAMGAEAFLRGMRIGKGYIFQQK